MQQDKRTFKQLHYDLWDWIRKNPGKRKDQWPEWEDNGGTLPKTPGCCFACAEARRAYLTSDREKAVCDHCPIEGLDDFTDCHSTEVYPEWVGNTDLAPDIRSDLAKQIRDAW